MSTAPEPDRPRWPARPTGLAFGGDYNPEQWPEATWLEDVELMRRAGVNLVTVGVFAWSRIQPGPDRWEFAWLHRILDLLHENGIAVDLATGTASPPPWFAHRHPESLPVTDTGIRLEIGSRQHVCPSSEAFRAAASALVDRLAMQFGGHPAIVLWHIGNEYGDHVRECFCDASAAAFRQWLRDRHGSLDALNDAWTSDVWGNWYGAWGEVMPPRAAPGPRNPGQMVDWRRFSSDAFIACFEAEREILGRLTPATPVTTNFMRLNDGLDHWRLAEREDVVSADLYPDPADASSIGEIALSQDLMRSLGAGRPWLLMEQARSAVDWRRVNLPRRPEVMRATSIEAIARGADGVMFFQWRGARGGAEAFHSVMLPPGGTETRGWAVTSTLGADVARLAEIAGSTIRASTALLIAWDNWWALEREGHPTDRLRFAEQALRFYRPLRASNVAVDIRAPGDDLSGYRLVVAPNVFMLDPRAALDLAAYVHDGGTLVVGPFSGVVDPDYHVPSGHYPALLRDLLGAHWEEIWPLAEGEVSVRFDSGERAFATIWRDALDLDGAVTVAAYEDGDLAGWPAVTRHSYGAGQVWYVGCVLDDLGMTTVLEQARLSSGAVAAAAAPTGVIATRREASGVDYLFYINYSASEVEIEVPAHGSDLLTGAEVRTGSPISLAPYDAVVVRVNHAAYGDTTQAD